MPRGPFGKPMNHATSRNCPVPHAWNEPFTERFALAALRESGVLLDLHTGAYHSLNNSAMQICASLKQSKTPDEAAVLLAKAWGKGTIEIKRAIQGLLSDLETTPPIQTNNALSFERDGSGVLMVLWGRAVMRLDRHGRTITSLVGEPASSDDLAAVLLLAVPHLLTWRRQAVLHASAVQSTQGTLAFCGGSGQGKTTTARCFAGQGAALLSEDLLLLSLDQETPHVIRDAEPAIRRWVGQQAVLLAQQSQIETDTLDAALVGATLSLDEIFFLERVRQTSGRLVRTRLDPAAGLVGLLENSFAEIGVREVWSNVLHVNWRLASAVPLSVLAVPDGLDLLADAVRNYSRTVT
jgi:hypothetical protein